MDFDSYFTSAAMDYKPLSSEKYCKSEVEVSTPNPITLVYKKEISSDTFQISLPFPSRMIHYQVTNNDKLYYLAFYTNDFQFSIYDISNYNVLDGSVEPVQQVLTLSFSKNSPYTNIDFYGCQGLEFRGDVIFYTLCWDAKGKSYIVHIDVKGFEKLPPHRYPTYRVTVSPPLNFWYRVGSKYTVAYDTYIVYPKFSNNTNVIEAFCYLNFLNPTSTHVKDNG